MERMILRSSPYELLEAMDGEHAVQKARDERPDLILMDMVMPRMTGLEALEALRASDETREIPVVMVTTRGEESNVEAAQALGCDDYLTKPIDPSKLLATVAGIVGDGGERSNG